MYFLVLPQQSSLLGLYGPVLLHLLGNTGKYSPSCYTNTENQLFQYCPTRKDNTGNITFRNWECLYYDSSRDIRWNIAWALGKSLGLRPRYFPRVQATFHRMSLLLSEYRYIIVITNNISTVSCISDWYEVILRVWEIYDEPALNKAYNPLNKISTSSCGKP